MRRAFAEGRVREQHQGWPSEFFQTLGVFVDELHKQFCSLPSLKIQAMPICALAHDLGVNAS